MQSFIRIIKNNFAETLAAFAFWALLMLKFGYAFATGDHAEFVPYALKITDPSLYKTDLFIQKLAENPINERIFFCSFLSVFSSHLETVCFAGHLLFTVLLVIGLHKICQLFIKNSFFSYLVVFALLIFFSGKFPGGATMYANSFLPDTVSHALGVWGFYFLLKNRILLSSAFLILATLMHPLIGLFVALLSYGGYFFHILFDQKILPSKQFFGAILIYLLTAGLYLFLLIPDEAKTLTDEAYYRIFFELRYPHHTLPSHFPRSGMFALVLLAFAGLIYFYRNQKIIFWFLLLQCIGFCIYAVAVEYFHLVEIGLTQWFRSSMWTYFLGLIALASMAEKNLNISLKPGKIFFMLCGIFAATVFIILYLNPSLFPAGNPYEIGRNKYRNEDIVVSEKIRELNLEGTFVLPFNFNAHKYYSQQSSYADYKTIPRKNKNLGEWYRRMNLIYDLDTAHHLYGFEAEHKAKEFYRNMPDSNLLKLKHEGVKYMLTDTPMQNPLLKALLKTENYYVYAFR